MLYEVITQASYEIERRIFLGELKPGDRLPPERELAAAMGISRAAETAQNLDQPMAFLDDACVITSYSIHYTKLYDAPRT